MLIYSKFKATKFCLIYSTLYSSSPLIMSRRHTYKITSHLFHLKLTDFRKLLHKLAKRGKLILVFPFAITAYFSRTLLQFQSIILCYCTNECCWTCGKNIANAYDSYSKALAAFCCIVKLSVKITTVCKDTNC